MIEYVHRVVYCSERKNRCRREEITVTGTDMMVTRVEELPLHYDAAVERLRSPGEALIFTRGGLRYWSGYQGCPFCRNREVIFCPACERYSCWNRQKQISICAWCGKIGEPVSGPGLPLSESGMVHGRGSKNVGGSTQNEERLGTPPDGRKESARGDLRKYLEEQAKKRLEDKRGKK